MTSGCHDFFFSELKRQIVVNVEGALPPPPVSAVSYKTKILANMSNSKRKLQFVLLVFFIIIN